MAPYVSGPGRISIMPVEQMTNDEAAALAASSEANPWDFRELITQTRRATTTMSRLYYEFANYTWPGEGDESTQPGVGSE